MKKLFIALTFIMLYAGGLNAQTFDFSCIDYSSLGGYDLSITANELTNGQDPILILQANLTGKELPAIETLFISTNEIESYFANWTIAWSLNGVAIDDGDDADYSLIIQNPEAGTYQVTVTDDYGISRSVIAEYTIQQTFMESDAGDKNSDGDTLDTGVFFDGVQDFYQVVTDIDIDFNELNLTGEWQTFDVSYGRDINLVFTTNFAEAQVDLQVNNGGWTTISGLDPDTGDALVTVGNGYSITIPAEDVALYGDANYRFRVFDDQGSPIENDLIYFSTDAQTEAEFNAETDPDGDGVLNVNDDCPNMAGPANNNGCPIIADQPDLDPIYFDANPTYSIGDTIRILVNGDNVQATTNYVIFLGANSGAISAGLTRNVKSSGKNTGGNWILDFTMPELPAGHRDKDWKVWIYAQNGVDPFDGQVPFETKVSTKVVKHNQSN